MSTMMFLSQALLLVIFWVTNYTHNYAADTVQTRQIRYESGRLKEIAEFRDTVRHGWTKRFYDDSLSHKLVEMPYSNGKRHGRAMFYYQNGQIERIEQYENGQLHGRCEYFSEDGNIQARVHYVNGKPNGKAYLYYPNGNVRSEEHQVDGVLEGLFTVWDDQRVLKYQTMYEAGKAVWKKEFDKNGNVTNEIHYTDDKKFNTEPQLELREKR